MNADRIGLVSVTLFALVGVLVAGLAVAQNPAAKKPGQVSQTQAGAPYSTDDTATESRAIWESQEMLEARAWLDNYFRLSAQISDAQAKKFMAELRAMTPDQMRLWLVKFHQERDRRAAEGKRFRQANRKALEIQMASPQIGGFRNPYSGQRSRGTGLASSGMRPTFGGQYNPMAQRPSVQKPFSSPQYMDSVRPLVTAREVARAEVLRGLGPWGY